MAKSLREKAMELPLLPGVYMMLDKTGQIIYVGKAKALKNRVSSYFSGDHEIKTELMVSKVADFDVIIVDSEFEALVLENSLIKRHMPKYNIRLRDDKGYPYVRLDSGAAYPAFEVVSKPRGDGARYFGPYSGRAAARAALDAVRKAMKLPSCGRRFPRDIGKARPCLNYHMGACLAYCQEDTPRAAHAAAVDAAVKVFEGRTAELREQLSREMEEAAENLQFEAAAELRDRLRAALTLERKRLAVSVAMADTDVFGYFKGEAKSCYTVLHYVGGGLAGKDFELLDSPLEDDAEAVSGIVRQYYAMVGAFPKNILLPIETPDMALLERLFSETAGRRVYIASPQRGEKRQMLETANVNAREETERASTREEKTRRSLEWLQKALDLAEYPARIEAFDISNTGGSDIAASMTVFAGGRPLKRDYRRFKIKTVQGQDDYSSMAEVVSRRVGRFLDGDERFAPLPEVMLIDGGAQHARVARAAVNALGVRLPVFGMVKDERHRTRALVSPEGDEIGLSGNPAAFALIGAIQEETHRFAIEYHRQLRSKTGYRSRLEQIEGVGEARRKQLLKAFGSIRAMREAPLEELARAVPRNVAEKVYDYFHPRNTEDAQEKRI